MIFNHSKSKEYFEDILLILSTFEGLLSGRYCLIYHKLYSEISVHVLLTLKMISIESTGLKLIANKGSFHP